MIGLSAKQGAVGIGLAAALMLAWPGEVEAFPAPTLHKPYKRRGRVHKTYFDPFTIHAGGGYTLTRDPGQIEKPIGERDIQGGDGFGRYRIGAAHILKWGAIMGGATAQVSHRLRPAFGLESELWIPLSVGYIPVGIGGHVDTGGAWGATVYSGFGYVGVEYQFRNLDYPTSTVFFKLNLAFGWIWRTF